MHSGADVAVRIERVEREFILGVAIEQGFEARLQAQGRTKACRLSRLGKESLSLSLEDPGSTFHARERVSVYFDFQGQGVVLESRIQRSGPSSLELDLPEFMYRSLQRRWPRVRSPQGIRVDLLLPDEGLKLDCPESMEWFEVEKPQVEPALGLDTSSLAALVDSFKGVASSLADEGRVIMYKGRGPADHAEELAARLGRILYLPSLPGPLPTEDPFPPARVATADMVLDLDGPSALAGGSKLAACLAGKAAEGLGSAIWCPISYYRYTVGMVVLSSGPVRGLGREAVDLAWEFSRLLSWFLKRHGYFASLEEARMKGAGAVVDASPSGLLVQLPKEGPGIQEGSTLRLALAHGGRNFVCDVRVARSYDEGKARFYGLAFRGLPAEEQASLIEELYGEALPDGLAC